ncbi:MAG: glutamate--tRNA ligase, partial [Deltaproteobacteria bacterium]|nr:glutamate--tRNA ligase [Deltaproteobacteria bacterium]
MDIYPEFVNKLLESGRAYPCYCTEEELTLERKMQMARGVPPRYSGRCLQLTAKNKAALENEGRKPSIRFHCGTDQIKFHDLIKGDMHFDGSLLGDFIVVRSTGIPAYNFAVVIDDHLMNISHVIRGEDHVSNTPFQLLLYDFFGFTPPQFGHHSLLLGTDRSK